MCISKAPQGKVQFNINTKKEMVQRMEKQTLENGQSMEHRLESLIRDKAEEKARLDAERADVEKALATWRFMTFGMRDTIRRLYADRSKNLAQEISDLKEAFERMTA